MATVIDALVVSLGLDASGFKTGSESARTDLGKTKESANSAAKEIEASGKQAAEFFTKLRNEAIGLFAAFTAGVGLKDFIRDTSSAEAATGRMAHNLQLSVATLSTWQGASERTGGSAAATAASLQGLTQAFQDIQLTGNSAIIPVLRRLGINDLGELNNVPGVLQKIHDQFKDMDPRQANALGQRLGLDQGMINLLELPDAQYNKIMEDQRRLGVVTREDAEAGTALTNSWKDMLQASTTLGRGVLTDLTPAFVIFFRVLTEIFEWVHAHPRIADAMFIGLGIMVTRLSALITGSLIRLALLPLTAAFGTASVAGAGFTAELGAMTAAGTGLLSVLGLIAVAAGAAYLGFHVSGLNKGEDEELKRMRAQGNLSAGAPAGSITGPAPPIADTSMGPEQQAFLNTLAGPESGGRYDIKNGGKTFSGTQFPEGVAPGGTSTAAGRYQFTSGTWRDVSGRLGLQDFSPANQDRGAWYLADTTYRHNTGRDLAADLRAGGHEQQIAAALRSVWPSLPGGSQSHQTPAQFASSLDRNRTAANGGTAPAPAAGPQPQQALTRTANTALDAVPVDRGLMVGAQAAIASNTSNDNRQSSSSSSHSETHIGQITVSTTEANAPGIAKGIREAMARYGYVPQANTGLA